MEKQFQMTRADRVKFSKKSKATALLLFALAMGMYLILFIGTLFVSGPISYALSALCGLAIGVLFIIGHDACHHSYTGSGLLNNVIGRLAFLPSLHPFSLWDVGHNKVHHKFNNIRGKDYVWEPMSPDEFSKSSTLKKFFYQFFRHPLGIPLYYMPEIWMKKMAIPRPSVLGEMKPIYLFDSIFVWSFCAAQVWVCIAVGKAFGKGGAESAIVSMIIPFLVWNGLMSIVIYLHHMHPKAVWYSSVEEWRHDQGAINGTVHVRFPLIVRSVLLNIMEHNAHHFFPGAPLYRLPPLQAKMAEETSVISWTWSLPAFLNICWQCKLFDYEKRAWVGFGEQPAKAGIRRSSHWRRCGAHHESGAGRGGGRGQTTR